MKKICGILMSLSLVLGNCSNNQNVKIRPNLIVPSNASIADSIEKTLNDYLEYLSHNKYIVYQIFTNQYSDSSVFFITFVQYRKELDQYLPSGFIKIDSSLFLVYSGIEKLLNSDPEFNYKIKNELSKIFLNEEDDPPFVLEQRPWSITYFFKDKSYKVNKRANCPYGWPKSYY